MEVKPKPNLLTIELTDEQSIPRVVYKGEEITGRIAVDFEWRTKDADQCGSTYYRIKIRFCIFKSENKATCHTQSSI